MNAIQSNHSSEQDSMIVDVDMKTDNSLTPSNESIVYTKFWNRLFKKSKKVKQDNLQSNISYQRTSNHITSLDRPIKIRPVSIDTSEIKNNPHRYERKHLVDYGHHQFQITSLSTRKQRLLRNHNQYHHNTLTNNNNNNDRDTTTTTTTVTNHISSSYNSSLPTTIQSMPETESLYSYVNNKRTLSKSDLTKCNLSKRESKSQNHLHFDESPKMRYVRKIHAFGSVPDLTKRPIRSALKVQEREQVTMSPNPLNSESFSLTPPTPVEMRHLIHYHASDIPNTTMNIKPVTKMDIQKSDDSDWLINKFDLTNQNRRTSYGLKIEYSQYSPELKGSRESNRRNLEFLLKSENNKESSNDTDYHDDINKAVRNVELEPVNKIEISRDYENMNNKHNGMIANDDNEEELEHDNTNNELNIERSVPLTPRFHSKLLRRDSIEYYLDANKSHSLHHHDDNYTESMRNVDDHDEISKNAIDFHGKSSEIIHVVVEEEEEVDDDADHQIEETSASSVSNSIRDDYSPKPLITEVLSPALCASGYGPVGNLLTRWLPQRNFCELLSNNYAEVMTDEMFMLRFSEFVEVQELEPCDRSADKPWIRLTSKDKVR
ncbi:Phosphatase and actin regulator 2 [Schistosoma japonicum]|nr:Phosphatase and actin regulator 2 [Schistosoma japonicum]